MHQRQNNHTSQPDTHLLHGAILLSASSRRAAIPSPRLTVLRLHDTALRERLDTRRLLFLDLSGTDHDGLSDGRYAVHDDVYQDWAGREDGWVGRELRDVEYACAVFVTRIRALKLEVALAHVLL